MAMNLQNEMMKLAKEITAKTYKLQGLSKVGLKPITIRKGTKEELEDWMLDNKFKKVNGPPHPQKKIRGVEYWYDARYDTTYILTD